MRPKHLFQPVIAAGLIVVFLSSPALAQTRRHDLSLSYGFLTMDQLVDVLEDILTVTITLGIYSKQNMTFTGAPFLTYHYSPGGRFGIGFAVGTYASKGNLTIGGTTDGRFKETNYIGAFEVDYHWVLNRGFQLYSGAGIGVRVRKGSYTAQAALQPSTEVISKALPTFHINLLGFRVGRRVGVFGELGAGYKGVFNVGLNAQF